MIRIDKNVPMPKLGPGRPRIYPWLEMEEGDSFLVTNKTGPEMSAMAAQVSRRHPHLRFTVRTEKEGIRIWRCKKNPETGLCVLSQPPSRQKPQEKQRSSVSGG